MQTMICEICGSTTLVKEHGFFVCRFCNTKYTLEEARKLLQNVTDEEPRDVEALRLLARRAMESGQEQRAKRYYELALLQNPNLWDAWFYGIYFDALNCRSNEIIDMAEQLYDGQDPLLWLVRDFVTDPQKEHEAIQELTQRMIEVCDHLFFASKSSHYDKVVRNKLFENAKYVAEGSCCRDALYHFGDLLVLHFKDLYGDLAATCWEAATKLHGVLHPTLQDKKASERLLYAYGRKIRKYHPHFTAPRLKKAGCYVATAIYGSYDCGPVWVLRRYRDDTLAKSRFGRLFIRCYYAVSPGLVRLFGQSRWFSRLIRPRLNRLVSRLMAEGVSDLPYSDQ